MFQIRKEKSGFKITRRQLWVDPDVQGLILRRVVLYWIACLLFVSIPHAIVLSFTDPSRIFFQHVGDVWIQYWPILLTATILLPFVLYDALRFSNRFAGPVYRLRRELKNYIQGESYKDIKFREGDYWPDLADCCNQIVRKAENSEDAVNEIPKEEHAKEMVTEA